MRSCHQEWNSSYAELDYDSVTKNLIDYVIGEETQFEGGIHKSFIYKLNPELGTERVKKITTMYGYKGTNNGQTRVYISSRKAYQKCITFDMPNEIGQKLQLATLVLRNSIFPNGIRPAIYGSQGFSAFFHYQNQLFRSTIAAKYIWPDREDGYTKHIVSTFSLTSMEIFRSRNKIQNKCIHYHNYDHDFKDMMMQKIGCVPPYWKTRLNLSKCISKTHPKFVK